jgi:histone deacetylase 11
MMKNRMRFIFHIILLIFILSCRGDDPHPSGGPAMATCIPIIYSPQYNISLGGIEKYHPFDTAKYNTVRDYLVAKGLVKPEDIIEAPMASEAELLLVHSARYLASLTDPLVAARIAEVNELAFLPSSLIEEGLYRPMKYATGGTILGAQLALQNNAAVNLSGGYHHAKREGGGGFCYFSDIAIAVSVLWQTKPDLKVMIVDLDAHQGNGYASIFAGDPRIVIFDVYNGDIFPRDENAERYIDFPFKIKSQTDTDTYLALIARELPGALLKTKPGLIIYNAGTDIDARDPLGGLAVSEEGIIKRDELVFSEARKSQAPILMLLSGGYTRESGRIIAHSLENLLRIAGGMSK